MPRKVIRRLLPHPHFVRGHRSLRFLGERLHDPNLWHLTRNSVAGAIGLGLFVAFLPVPLQMGIAAAGAVFFRVNLPIAALSVWLTNPVTIAPLFYFAYRVGAAVTGFQPRAWSGNFSAGDLMHTVEEIWVPLLVGSLITGTLAGLLGFGLVRLVWRIAVTRRWRRRQLKSSGPPESPR